MDSFFKKLITIILLISSTYILGSCSTDNTQNETTMSDLNTPETIEKTTPIEEQPTINETQPPKIEPPINMLFMGDVMMDSYVAENIERFGIDYPWEDVSEITAEADISVVNLETSVSNRGSTKKPKGFGFRSKPETLSGLQNSGIDLVSLANNHIMDFGADALSDTLASLGDYNIKSVGAGEDISQASSLVTIEKNGSTVGFLSYTSIIPWDGWSATEGSPGVAPLDQKNYEHILEKINEANKSVDILVILLHWGTEYKDTPNEWQIELAHKMVDNGADLIVGHHPHILQGIEFYKDTPILYSIGNFIFLKKDDDAGNTGMFKVTFENNKFKEGFFYPVYIKYTKANLLDASETTGKKIVEMLNRLSKPFGTTVDEAGFFSRLN